MLTILAVLALGGVPILLDQPDLHARSDEAAVKALIQEGMTRSPTFRAVVAALSASDVVAYVQTSLRMKTATNSTDPGGYLVHQVTKAGGLRYVQIAVNPTLGRDRLISVIAHELQHAVEIAHDPTVDSEEAVRALFRRLSGFNSGMCAPDRRCMETDAAVRVGNSVLRELRK
jgi:hypothetical protein